MTVDQTGMLSGIFTYFNEYAKKQRIKMLVTTLFIL
jgi:hypothetical protein